MEKPVAVAQWIAQISQLWGFDIARFLFIFLSNSLKVQTCANIDKKCNAFKAKFKK